nr:hypothetical protein [uncultured Arsenicibacter sp.]
MSVSSNQRKESTDSYASQAMHSPMGLAPELSQLSDRQLENELPSKRADSNDTDVPGDYVEAKSLAVENDDATTEADIEEAKRASWGQPPIDAENATIDPANPMVAYQPESAPGGDVTPPDGAWNKSTAEGGLAPSSADEPDKTTGNA